MENGQGAESNGMDRFVWSMVGGENLPKKFHEERMKSEKKNLLVRRRVKEEGRR